jgi:hypothetical protein
MANTFSPFGFRAFGRREGGAPTAGMDRRYILSSDTNTYFTGDVVSISSASVVAGYLTLPSSGSVLGSPLEGIFMGCEYYSASAGKVVWNSYFPGSVGSSAPVNAYVVTDPEQLFLVQGTTTAVLGTSCIGLNVGIASSLQTTGNTATGISGLALNSSTVAAANTLPFRIVDTTSNYAPPGVNGTDGTVGGAIVVVQMNNSARRSLTGVTT